MQEYQTKAIEKLQYIFDKYYEFPPDESHDIAHAKAVALNARHIFEDELKYSLILNPGKQNFETYEKIICLTSIFHDAYDHKYVKNKEQIAEIKLEISNFLRQSLTPHQIEIVFDVIDNMSYSKGIYNKLNNIKHVPLNKIVFDIVQDADRVEAIGVIGVRRNYLYTLNKIFGGVKDDKKIHQKMIEHMHEKLILLWGILNTESAKKIYKDRHEYTAHYLQELESKQSK